MADVTDLAGRVIAGRYRLTSQLGRGGMGSVWRADDLTLGSPVAVKLLDHVLAENESARGRFYQEARAAASLRSPHVVQTLDYGVDAGIPFIAMELLEGETLADRLGRTRVIPLAHTARILTDVARALHKAHGAGVVHRDLKPENIFLVKNDDQEVAKILDFGVAKVDSAVEGAILATRAGTLLGTVPYMSPEQARGQSIDLRSDLWALGVIAFECVCGRLPFPAEQPADLVIQICAEPIPVPSEVARVPVGFDAWFARAVARDVGERFQTAKEMVEALGRVLIALRGGDGKLSSLLSIPPSMRPFTEAPASPRSISDRPKDLQTMSEAQEADGGARPQTPAPISIRVLDDDDEDARSSPRLPRNADRGLPELLLTLGDAFEVVDEPVSSTRPSSPPPIPGRASRPPPRRPGPPPSKRSAVGVPDSVKPSVAMFEGMSASQGSIDSGAALERPPMSAPAKRSPGVMVLAAVAAGLLVVGALLALGGKKGAASGGDMPVPAASAEVAPPPSAAPPTSPISDAGAATAVASASASPGATPAKGGSGTKTLRSTVGPTVDRVSPAATSKPKDRIGF